MSVLAFKALDYGAEQIPDSFFEKIPGGFFTPQEKKDIKKGRKERKDKERHQSEQRSSKRDSRRDRSPQSDYSGHSAYDDTDYERERAQRKKDRRRAKSAGRSPSRSMSRGRDNRRSRDLDGEYSDPRDVGRAEQGGPYFAPPPSSAEYRPYNPQEYASPATPAYGYPSQVNSFSPLRIFRHASISMTPEHPTPVNSCPPMLMCRTASNYSSPFPFHPPLNKHLSCGTPVSATFNPSYEPPLAALLQRPITNTSKPAATQAHPTQHPPSASTSKYTPGPGYAPSPSINASIPAPPVGANSPYAPYNPADYPLNSTGYQASGNPYSSPPPFQRQRSNSQPSFNPPYQTYTPPSSDQQMAAYNGPPPIRHGSTKSRREHRHRARSADPHSRHSRKDGHHRESSRMTDKVRERFDGMDMRERGLAATVGGALAGGLAGRQLGDRRSRSHSRSRSRSRSRAKGTRSRDQSYERSSPRGIRARSKSIIDRFRSKSRGPEDRETHAERHDRDRRPDHGYDHDRGNYDYFSSESEGDGSPVKSRRRRRRE
ncbi:hypothetical protein BKA66DRAFT_514704 [Pyrenochaeta sp. MPI-SDFR-AT-0127]|nr:hypothetical protein BKA66DRAFT_514704 [Pyrenochaeta sp. MPI-SDFR-AT-0127]